MKNLITIKNILEWTVLFNILLFSPYVKAEAHVYVNPQTTVLSGQSSITVDFMISNVDSLQSYIISVLFNNSILAFHSTSKGPFLSTGGNTLYFKSPTTVIDSVQVTEALYGPNHPPVSGSGKLFSITFNVLSAGSSTINIDYVYLAHQRGNSSIPVTWTSGEVIVPLSVNAKVFLQGPFNTNIMSTALNSFGYLPLTQPYSGTPWNYSGTESVPLGFFSNHSNIVDWILIELRTGTGSGTIVERKAGFITNTGSIVALDGISTLYLNRSKASYYIVIYHRNHIPIMSSVPTSLDYISTLYDFTNSQTKAYGTNAMVNLGGGYFGAYTGDTDGSRTVNATDRSNTWNQRNIQGYNGSDVDLSGTVNAADRSVVWNNRNVSSQVPN